MQTRERLSSSEDEAASRYPQDVCIHQLFEMQALRTPDGVAVAFEGGQVTYGELNRRANQLAHFLRLQGVAPGSFVGICVEPSLEMVVGLLGILKAGGVYVPLDPAYPEERLAYMLEDVQASILLTQQDVTLGLSLQNLSLHFLDAGWHEICQQSAESLDAGTNSNSLAYVIYTSGSTGRPKGVCCNHKGVINLLADFESRRPLCVGDGCSVWTSLSFDVSVYEIFSALLAGGAVYPVPTQVRSFTKDFFAWLQVQGIRSAYIPPFMLAELLAGLQDESLSLALHRLLVGVEPIPERLLAQLQAKIPDLHIINGYGPTEATICATLYDVPGYAPQKERNTPIGRVVQNTSVFLLDEHLRPVPPGLAGEVYIGGMGLAQGYFNRPALTAERFIPDPLSNEPGARLYKTGDLARYLPDGNIEFIGRADYQLKLRGYRIEPGEIEVVLRHHPEVRDAVVAVREDQPGEKRLVAYLIAGSEYAPTRKELRRFLKEKLPAYMIPAAFVMMEAFPLTPSGKIDRQRLPAPQMNELVEEETYVAPGTPVEEVLVNLWQARLGVERIGIHDNFYELGGHSLAATSILSRLREIFKLPLTLRTVLEHATIAEQARLIEDLIGAASNEEVLEIAPVERAGPLPLSFAQQRVWFMDQLVPGNTFYNIPLLLRLMGKLNVEALERSLHTILERHQALRTIFTSPEGEPVQHILPVSPLSMRLFDLRGIEERARTDEARRLADEEARLPFDLAQGPLLRASLLRLQEREHWLLLTIHHICFDGWSSGVLFQELTELYEAFISGRPHQLPALPIQYVDYADWQVRRFQQEDALEAQLSYWQERFRDLPPLLELPTDHPRPSAQTFKGAQTSFALPAGLARSLHALSQQAGTTYFMTLLAAFMALLYRYSDQHDMAVGTVISGRDHAETENLIGFFVNTLILRAKLSRHLSFRELLAQVKEVTLEAFAHQELPFDRLIEALHPARQAGYVPLISVMFVLQNAFVQERDLPELHLSLNERSNGSAQFDLTLQLSELSDGLGGMIEYNTDLFEPETVARMIAHLQTLLESIVLSPDEPLCTLQILPEAERERVLYAWNQTRREVEFACWPELFEQQVRQTPAAIALVAGELQLSYQELNQRANGLAHHLRELGVGSETLVGICLERGPQWIVAILAILKAGGAYIPLDPSYPAQRLAFLVRDSRLKTLLTRPCLQDRLPVDEVEQVIDIESLYLYLHLPEHSKENLPSQTGPESAAYVIYTSGSSGQPKGVLVTHRGIANLRAQLETFGPFNGLRVLQFATFNFDASVLELVMALTTGATLVLPEAEQILPGVEMQGWLQQQAISSTLLPRSVLAELPAVAPPALSTLFTGGEACTAEVVNRWAVGRRFFNAYGPTEATIAASAAQCFRDQPVSIGRPFFNTQLYILNEAFHPQPVGVAGELYIGGIGLSRGYLNRPELTAERFIPHPFSQEPGARLYRTGDRARFLPDGSIDMLGRMDHQIKLRGYRIELEEIEAVLEQYAAVQRAVVLVAERNGGEQFLLAYVMAEGGNGFSLEELRHHLQEKVPAYMVPARFIVLDTLPLLPNGKVDRKALARRELLPLEAEGASDGALTPIEERLITIWGEILGLKQIGIHDNFFDLGGHSLSATRLISRVRSSLHIDIPVRTIFETPTVNSFAHIIEEKQGIGTLNGNTDSVIAGEDETIQDLLQEHNDFEDHQLASLLAKIESLSEEEVLRQLQQRMLSVE